jgi:hypothetical protein
MMMMIEKSVYDLFISSDGLIQTVKHLKILQKITQIEFVIIAVVTVYFFDNYKNSAIDAKSRKIYFLSFSEFSFSQKSFCHHKNSNRIIKTRTAA